MEHELSIFSAVHVMKNIDKSKYEIVPIYITNENEMYTGAFLNDIKIYSDIDNLKRYAKNVILYVKNNRIVLQNKKGFKRIVNEIDIIMPIFYNTNVESGTIQGYFDMLGIPYIGSNSSTISVIQDKTFLNNQLEINNLPTLSAISFQEYEYKNDLESLIKKLEKIKYPIIVKPVHYGNKLGISCASDRDELVLAIEEALKYDDRAIVTENIEDYKNVSVSIIGDSTGYEFSEILEIDNKENIIMNKNIDKQKNILNKKTKQEIIELATKLAKSLDIIGIARIDFKISQKKIFVDEIITTPDTVSAYLWEVKGISYEEILNKLIKLTINDYKNRNLKKNNLENNLLKKRELEKSMESKIK